MLDVIIDTLIDSVKLLPFLFFTYLAMEYIEHKTTAKTKRMIKNSGRSARQVLLQVPSLVLCLNAVSRRLRPIFMPEE